MTERFSRSDAYAMKLRSCYRAECLAHHATIQALRLGRMTLRVITVLAGAPVGGAETFFVSLTTALARAGLDVRSVLKANRDRQAALAEQGVMYSTGPFRSFLDFST